MTIRIVAETDETVTVRRQDWVELLAALEDAEDRAAVVQRRAKEQFAGKDAARRDYLTTAEATRLLNKENPIRVWREKRQLSQRALAAEARIGAGYLAEIELGRKPGSDDAYRRLAAVLGVTPDDLDLRKLRMREPDFGRILLRLNWVPPGISSGQRGPWADRQTFATLNDAIEFVRENWISIQGRSPRLTSQDGIVIYTADELNVVFSS